MTATEFGIFLEQALLNIKAEILGFMVFIIKVGMGHGVFVDVTVLEQHLVQGFPLIFR